MTTPGADSSTPSWRSIPVVRLDLDGPVLPNLPHSTTGDDAWVEIAKNGQVVGVRMTLVEGHTLSSDFVERAARDFADARPSFESLVPDELLPTATIIVPTICADSDVLLNNVESLLALDYPSFDVVVVDNRPSPTRSAMPNFPGGDRVTVVHQSTPGVSAARNRGMEVARGEFYAFTDDDVTVDRQWLRALANRFVQSPEVEAIGGLVLPRELKTQPQLWFEEFYGGFSRYFRTEFMSLALLHDDPLFPYDAGRFGAGNNMALRPAVVERLKGFNEVLGVGTTSRGGEDLAMFLKIVLDGGTVASEPAALVRHTHRQSEERFFRQVHGYGVGLTAMYLSFIVRDPRHLYKMAKRLPRGLRLLLRPREERSVSRAPSYPKKTNVLQLRGMLYGPLAYVRCVWQSRRASRRDGV